MGLIQGVDQADSLIVKFVLLFFHLFENHNSSLVVDELFGVKSVLETLDSIVLLDLMELYDCSLPGLIKDVEFLLFLPHYVFVESITFLMLSFVFGSFILDLLLHQLVNLRRQVKSNIDKFLSHASKIRPRAFLLEGFEIIESFPQVLDFLVPLAPLPINFLPDSINVSYLIGEE